MRRNLWKIVLIIAIAVLLLSGYIARRAQLEMERKEIENNMWSSWFEPANENMSKAIEEWDREGIASFCEREDIDEIMKIYQQRFFYVEEDVLYVNIDEFIRYGEVSIYNDEEIKNAMLLILYGENGLIVEDKVYTSSINSVTEISPYLLAICIFELNLEIAQNQEDNALEDWWDIKRRSYK